MDGEAFSGEVLCDTLDTTEPNNYYGFGSQEGTDEFDVLPSDKFPKLLAVALGFKRDGPYF